MSRIGNKIKAGFVATSSHQIELIRQLLKYTGDASTLDTCAGEGHALKALSTPVHDHDCRIATYGVEIDKGRGETATEVLDNVVVASIESMVISNEVASLCLLNPPYDMTVRDRMGKVERKEFLELMRCLRYLAPGGILIYIIPHYRFADENIADILASYFTEISVARFTDEDYSDFKQVVFIGRKKRNAYKEFNEDLFNAFVAMESEELVLSKIPTLADLVERGKAWEVPPGNTTIKTFYTRLDNKSEVAAAIRESKGFATFIQQSKPRQLEIQGNPALPPSSGQIALLLASGALNGVLAEGERLHALKGLEVVSKVTTEETTETGTITRIKTKREVSIKIITPKGIVKKLM